MSIKAKDEGEDKKSKQRRARVRESDEKALKFEVPARKFDLIYS
jgi:hypothetical protein